MHITLEIDNSLMLSFKKSYWCCSVETTKEAIVSKSTLIYTTEAVQIASNHTCGFLGLQICTNHHTVYK